MDPMFYQNALAICKAPCNHEEADTRMIVHMADAVNQGYTRVMIRTVYTDVVVLAVANKQQVPGLQELWAHVGTGKHQQYLPCHEIANTLGPQKAKDLRLFHAFTGCDTVSSFNGKGKKSAMETWITFPNATEGFLTAYEYEGRNSDAVSIIENDVDVVKANSTKSNEEADNVRHVIEDGIKSAIFGSNSYNPMLDKFVSHYRYTKKQKLVNEEIFTEMLTTTNNIKNAATTTTVSASKGPQPPADTSTSTIASTPKEVTKEETTASKPNEKESETTFPTSNDTDSTLKESTTSTETTVTTLTEATLTTTAEETLTTTTEATLSTLTEATLSTLTEAKLTTITEAPLTTPSETTPETQATKLRNQRVSFASVRGNDVYDHQLNALTSAMRSQQATEDYDWWPKVETRRREDYRRRNSYSNTRAMMMNDILSKMETNRLRFSDWWDKYNNKKRNYPPVKFQTKHAKMMFNFGNRRAWQTAIL